MADCTHSLAPGNQQSEGTETHLGGSSGFHDSCKNPQNCSNHRERVPPATGSTGRAVIPAEASKQGKATIERSLN